MVPRTLLVAIVAAGLAALSGAAAPTGEPAAFRTDRSLRVLSSNPRYFTDGSGRAVYLTGSHVWWNLLGSRTWKVDCDRGRVRPFRFRDYLDQLTGHGENFIRLWTIELTTWKQCGETVVVPLQPWRRVGPGLARDGLPKFDLRRLNPAYFSRLRSRVLAAKRRGVYVSVMLFEGWGELFQPKPWRAESHPFFRANNVNGVDPDLDGDGTLRELYSMRTPKSRRFQEAYVRRVIRTVGGFDNVLYEIANESSVSSSAWQYHMLDFVRRYEAGRGRRHPVGLSYLHGDQPGRVLSRSRADWIAPYDPRHLTDPPVAAGRKVVISDTDHHCGLCGDGTFPWKTFMRGYNPIFMDEGIQEQRDEDVRVAMGRTRRYALRLDLARSAPRPDLCSTRYCLVVPARQYLLYGPEGGPLTVDLSAAPGRRFSVEWGHPLRGAPVRGANVSGGGVERLTPPFGGPVIAFLRRTS
jgi:Family of unknown function (DUF6298)